jgi:tRNA G18 (ribose-2'-O)-methylase SpoU
MEHEKLKTNELNRLSISDYKNSHTNRIIVVLDNIRSAQNVGSFFRTCDAFGVEKIFLCGITATPPNKEIFKTALGATESVSWEYCEQTIDCINNFSQPNFEIFCIEQAKNSIMLNDFNPKSEKTLVLVFGNEVEGVEQNIINLSHGVIEIPQFGTKHSLNVSVAGGIVIWDVISKKLNSQEK